MKMTETVKNLEVKFMFHNWIELGQSEEFNLETHGCYSLALLNLSCQIMLCDTFQRSELNLLND